MRDCFLSMLNKPWLVKIATIAVVMLGCVGCDHKPERSKAALYNQKTAIELLLANDCMHCHGVVDKVIGPPYLAIADRYRGNNSIKHSLIEKVQLGGGGLWYGGVMSAHPLVEKRDIAKMVDWILQLQQYQPTSNSQLGKNQSSELFTLSTSSDTLHNKLDEKLYSGTLKKVPFLYDNISNIDPSMPIEAVKIEGNFEIHETGKYIIQLIKTNDAMLKIDGFNVINTSLSDQEAIVTLETGSHQLEVFSAGTKNQLALLIGDKHTDKITPLMSR